MSRKTLGLAPISSLFIIVVLIIVSWYHECFGERFLVDVCLNVRATSKSQR